MILVASLACTFFRCPAQLEHYQRPAVEVAPLTAMLAGATEVSSFGSVSTLLSESLHLKITNKRVLSSHRVIVAELHEAECSTGCFFCFVLFQADLVPFLLISMSLTAQQHDMKGRRVFLEVCVCGCV